MLEPGQPAEICLAVDDWIAGAAAPLERGELLLIDYGYPAAELYSPARGSTLRAYHRHRVHADPFVAIGRQDLTAHVDLTAVERAALAAGLAPFGRTTQAQFLADLGTGELLVATPDRIPPRPWSRTSAPAPRSCACSTRARPAPSPSSPSAAGWIPNLASEAFGQREERGGRRLAR